MIRKGAVVLGLAGVLGVWNYSAYQGLLNPASAQVAALEQARANTPGAAGNVLPWTLLEQTQAGTHGAPPRFPDALKALEGSEVAVAGVFSTLPSLSENKIARGGFLQPPSKFACCGVTCDPRTQLLMFVDCSQTPWTLPADRTLVQVRGRLKLETEDQSWGLFSLNDARIEALPSKP